MSKTTDLSDFLHNVTPENAPKFALPDFSS